MTIRTAPGIAIERFLQEAGPHEVDPFVRHEWEEDEEGQLKPIGPMQAISDRDYFRQQAVAAQTWGHLSPEEKQTIREKWLAPSVHYLYEKGEGGRPVHG